jgi:hypothetical protein
MAVIDAAAAGATVPTGVLGKVKAWWEGLTSTARTGLMVAGVGAIGFVAWKAHGAIKGRGMSGLGQPPFAVDPRYQRDRHFRVEPSGGRWAVIETDWKTGKVIRVRMTFDTKEEAQEAAHEANIVAPLRRKEHELPRGEDFLGDMGFYYHPAARAMFEKKKDEPPPPPKKPPEQFLPKTTPRAGVARG